MDEVQVTVEPSTREDVSPPAEAATEAVAAAAAASAAASADVGLLLGEMRATLESLRDQVSTLTQQMNTVAAGQESLHRMAEEQADLLAMCGEMLEASESEDGPEVPATTSGVTEIPVPAEALPPEKIAPAAGGARRSLLARVWVGR